MSLSPASLLARLDELKKWQEKQQQKLNHQHRLLAESRKSSQHDERLSETNRSDFRTIEGLSAFDSTNVSRGGSPDRSANHEERLVSPVRDFHQLLEQRLSNDCASHVVVTDKPKRPYLRRGTGLKRFNMNPGDQRRPFNRNALKKRTCSASNVVNDAGADRDSKTSESANRIDEKRTERGGRGRTERVSDCMVDVTPLKMPDLSMKAVWRNVGGDNVENGQKEPSCFRLSENDTQDEEKITLNLYNNNNLVSQINVLAATRFATSNRDEQRVEKDRDEEQEPESHTPEHGVAAIQLESPEPHVPSDQTLYEKALEKELMIFEALEQKVLHSSFSSTNSSVIRLLSSTPNKSRNVSPNKRPATADAIRVQPSDDLDHMNRFAMGESNGPMLKCVASPEVIRREMKAFSEQTHSAIFSLLGSLKGGRDVHDPASSVDVMEGVCPAEEMPEKEYRRESPESSVNSDDFQEKTVEQVDFNDEDCWSDIIADTSTVSSDSVESSAGSCARNSEKEAGKKRAGEEGADVKAERARGNGKGDCSEEQLARKLLELDAEIGKFRTENRRVQTAQVNLERQLREFKKEKKAFEKFVLEEKIKVEFYLEDEKKKLAKEKMVFERYVKENQNKTNRKEREEISNLKAELANLRESAKLKETRNATSQARLRNQIKTFEKENANLKEEVEKLHKQNAKLQAAQRYSRKTTDTKMLHEINRNLTKLTQDPKVAGQVKKIEQIAERQRRSLDEGDEAGPPDCGGERERRTSDEGGAPFRQRKTSGQEDSLRECSSPAASPYECYAQQFRFGRANGKEDEVPSKGESANVSCCKENDKNSINFEGGPMKCMTDVSLVRNYEMMFGEKDGVERQCVSGEGQNTKTEVILLNGCREITYSNGNKKTVSPDGNVIGMKYFNGDVKETKLLEGVVRYYYADTRTWHTTYADGTELLEFPNGQTERRTKDGTSEVRFPNGATKITNPDRSEIISYPDGTEVRINMGGEKIFILPNGQKEIHNEEHMRREYPDGTVKILYPDGIQETRYGNGRIRIKDKDGNLILDSFQEHL